MPSRRFSILLGLVLWSGVVAAPAAADEDRLFAGFHREPLEIPHPGAHTDGLFDGLPMPGVADSSSNFRAPRRLRPCCAFGQGLGFQVAFVSLPGFRLDNVLDAERLGRHRYDSGMVGIRNGMRRAFISEEKNGLVYTRRGGFVDLAHVRAYADWTIFLAHRVRALLPGGGLIELPDEGGRRVVVVEPVEPAWLEQQGRERVAVAVAQWLSYQLSVWHEAATWYGWSSVAIFPERVSAFSPEDLWSNLFGVQLAGAILDAEGARSERQYETNMDAALPEALRRLHAVSEECSRVAAAHVDGFWWDSRERLPSADVVIRRNFAVGPTLVPWRVALGAGPDHTGPLSDEVVTPAVLHLQERVADRPMGHLARLAIEVSGEMAGDFPFEAGGDRWIDQDELASVIETLRRQQTPL